MTTKTTIQHRCEGYRECAYWAEFTVTGPATGERYYVCSNCVRLFTNWPRERLVA